VSDALAFAGLLGAVGALAWASQQPAPPSSSSTSTPPRSPPRAQLPTAPAAVPAGLALRPPRGRRINWSAVSRGNASPDPALLLAQARRATGDDTITDDELAGARLATSEYDSGNLIEWACIVDAECNRARRAGLSLFEHLTRGQGYGSQGQGSRRKASTARDPYLAHLWAARLVLGGELAGVARGAERFFDPDAMDTLHRKWKAGLSKIKTTCDALNLLEAWSFDYHGSTRSGRCPFDRTKPGRSTEAWVGPIAHVNPAKLMLMKPLRLGAEHTERYQAARATLLAR
jgi:hypothetical protein